MESELRDHDHHGDSHVPLSFAFAYVAPRRVLIDQPVTLYWCALGAERVSISGQGDNYPPCSGQAASLRIFVKESQDIVLRAFKDGQEVSRTVTVIVEPLQGLVRSISADPIPVVQGTPSQLQWFAEGCDYVTISDDMGSPPAQFPCAGASYINIRPLHETTYTVRAFRRGNADLNFHYNEIWNDQLVGVNSLRVPVTLPPTQIYFDASLRDIMEDAITTLSWSVANATQVTITPDVGAVAPQGAANVSPKSTTNYRLIATRADGTVQLQDLTIAVRPKLKVRGVFMSPAGGIIRRGQQVAFNWTTEACAYVRLELPSGEPVSNDRPCVDGFAVHPAATTDYFLRIDDLYGGMQKVQLKVTVLDEPRLAIPLPPVPPTPIALPPAPPPPPAAPPPTPVPPVVETNAPPVTVAQPNLVPNVVDFSADPTVIIQGQAIKLSWRAINATRVVIKFPLRTLTFPPQGEREFKIQRSGALEIYAENTQYRSLAKTINVEVLSAQEYLLRHMTGH
jgi:hypothetical protein